MEKEHKKVGTGWESGAPKSAPSPPEFLLGHTKVGDDPKRRAAEVGDGGTDSKEEEKEEEESGEENEWDLMEAIVDRTKPCMGDKEPLSALSAVYPSNSYTIQKKIKMLYENYGSFRRARPDGNCFYRSFLFSYLEQVIEMDNGSEIQRILERLEELKKVYVNFLDGDVETFDDLFSELLQKIQSAFDSNPVLGFLRLVTSIEIRSREEYYRHFIGDLKQRNLYEYCQEQIIPMGIGCDQVEFAALANAFGVPLLVLCLYPFCVNLVRHVFGQIPDCVCAPMQQAPLETLLYSPGYFDILYPK